VSLCSFERLPHELGDDVVQPGVALVAGDVRHAPDEPARRGKDVPAQREEERGALVGLDGAAEVGQERAVDPRAREVRSAEPARDASLAAAFRDEEALRLGAALPGELDGPASGVVKRTR
jgi:hypothetical protein